MWTPAPPNRAAGVVAKPFHVEPVEPSLRKTSPVAAIDQASPLRSAVAFRSSFSVVALGAALIVYRSVPIVIVRPTSADVKVPDAAVKVSSSCVSEPSEPLGSSPVLPTTRSSLWSLLRSTSATAVVSRLSPGKSAASAAVNAPVPSLR